MHDYEFLRGLNREETIHEGKYTDILNGVVCFCTVISVDTAGRRVKVRCIAPSGHPMSDKTIDGVQSIQSLATSAGDEVYSAPPVDSQGILIVVESTPFVLGYYNPEQTGRDLTNSNAPALQNRQNLAIGDIVLYNAFQSRLIIRNFGLIEIQSTEQLKTIYTPDRDVLSVTCQNQKFLANGGFSAWETNDATQDTLITLVIQDNLAPTNIMRFDVGQNDSEVMFNARIGPPNEDIDVDEPVYQNIIKDNGDWVMTVTDKAAINITPTGAWTSVFSGVFKESITGTYDSSSDGARTLKTGKGLTVTAVADIDMVCKNINLQSSGTGTLGAGAAEALVLGQQLDTFLKQITSTFNTHSHMYVSPGGPALSSPPTGPMVPPTPALLSKKWTVE